MFKRAASKLSLKKRKKNGWIIEIESNIDLKLDIYYKLIAITFNLFNNFNLNFCELITIL